MLKPFGSLSLAVGSLSAGAASGGGATGASLAAFGFPSGRPINGDPGGSCCGAAAGAWPAGGCCAAAGKTASGAAKVAASNSDRAAQLVGIMSPPFEEVFPGEKTGASLGPQCPTTLRLVQSANAGKPTLAA